MKIAITQPNYLPWLGYFELLDTVDLWVSLDNVQLGKRSFQVRNRIADAKGNTSWLSISVEKAPQSTNINNIKLAQNDFWVSHLNMIKSRYAKSPFFSEVFAWLETLLIPGKTDINLSRYNTRIIIAIGEKIGIELKMNYASDIIPVLEGSAEDKILKLCNVIRPSAYYNFQNGIEAGLYKASSFKEQGIELWKQSYEHPTYKQTGDHFTSHLSIIDLLFYELPNALDIIRSGSHWLCLTK